MNEEQPRAFGRFAGAGGGWAARSARSYRGTAAGGVSKAKPASQSDDLGVLRSALRPRPRIALLLWIQRETEAGSGARRRGSAGTVAPAAPVADEDADASFYPLPEAEALPAVENAMVVRVQLPVSSLQLMGVPVSEERAGCQRAGRVFAGPGWFGARRAFGAIILFGGKS